MININRLKEKWNRLSNELALNESLYQQFWYWYSHPFRYYHDLYHIDYCLNKLEDVKDLLKNRHEVEVAIWFNDAIYDSRRSDNEEQSAKLAYEILKNDLAKSFVNNVSRLIMATRHNYIPKKIDEKIITDIDLSVLGLSEKEFDDYGKAIRKEYDWVKEEQYKIKRDEFLQKLLERPFIYSTKFFREKYEEQARKNLGRVINQ